MGKTEQRSFLKLLKGVAVPTLFVGSECWTLHRYMKRSSRDEISCPITKHERSDPIHYRDIREQVNIFSVNGNIINYKRS
jgi:hypothetical protein